MEIVMRRLGELVSETAERLRTGHATIYSVTNSDGFVPSLDRFDKQVFSADTSSYKVVKHQDLAYNPSRINVGSVAICNDPAGGAVSPMYVIVRCNAQLSPEYLLHFLKSDLGQQEIRRRTEGSVRFQLKFRDLCQIAIPLPNLAEQERIVALLDEADALRKLRAQADQRTADLIPALFHDMFGDPATNPMGWPTSFFGDLLQEGLRNGVSPSKNGAYSRWVLTLSAITGSVFEGAARKLAAFTYENNPNSIVKENLFLICRGNGNLRLVGRAKFSNALTTPTIFPDTMIAASPDRERISNHLWGFEEGILISDDECPKPDAASSKIRHRRPGS